MDFIKIVLGGIVLFFATCFIAILVPFFLAKPLIVFCVVIVSIAIASSLFSAVRKCL